MAEEYELEPGEVLLGKYRVEEKIGEGGVAVIYKASQMGLLGTPAPVVLKVIKPSLTTSQEIIRGFAQETSVGKALQHPNITEFIDQGEDDDMLFMVLEYIAGKDLGALVHRVSRSRRVLRPEIIAFIAIEVCKALECSHGHFTPTGEPAPVIHRDVSPQNILLAFDGRVKLADFGMARALNMARQTQYGVIKGKLSYMSPEQSTGADVDARSDIFSLGIVMWESLCARRLFLRKKQIDTIFAVREVKVPPVSKFAPHVPQQLSSIVQQALRKAPEERYQSATQMRLALQGYLNKAEATDAEGLSGVLAAYFPDEHEAALAAEPALSFDDETNDVRDFDIDDAPPVDEAPTGLVAANTVMVDRDSMVDLQTQMEEAIRELEAAESMELGIDDLEIDDDYDDDDDETVIGAPDIPPEILAGLDAAEFGGTAPGGNPIAQAMAAPAGSPQPPPNTPAHAPLKTMVQQGAWNPNNPFPGAQPGREIPPTHSGQQGVGAPGWPNNQQQGGWPNQGAAPQQGGWPNQGAAPQQGGWPPQQQVPPKASNKLNWILFGLIFVLGLPLIAVLVTLAFILINR